MSVLPRRVTDRLVYDPSGCLLSTGSLTTHGYAQWRIGGKTVNAHRFMYELAVGPIPDGLVMDHLCRRRNCVNWLHVEPVTQRVNVLRGTAPAAHHAVKTECPAGHPYTDENTIRTPQGWRRCRECERARTQARTERARREVAQRPGPTLADATPCPICQAPVLPRTNGGRPRIYCSERCMETAGRRRRRAALRRRDLLGALRVLVEAGAR
jgi:predicted nucleic acid-binding Zn ribbon protein